MKEKKNISTIDLLYNSPSQKTVVPQQKDIHTHRQILNLNAEIHLAAYSPVEELTLPAI